MRIQFQRINRNQSNLTFRPRRRRVFAGCLPLTLVLSIALALAATSWNWLGARLNITATPDANSELELAQYAFNSGDLDTAISLSRQIWTNQPNSIDGLFLLIRGLIYRSYSDYNRDVDREIALQITTEAYNRMPSDPDISAIHAFALQATSDPILSARLAQGVLGRVPDHQLAQIALTLAFGRVGGYDAALRQAQQISLEGDLALEVYRALAISHSDLGHYDEAINAIDQALGINNRLAFLHFERAEFALHTSDFDTATAAFFHVLAFDAENTKVRLRMCDLSIRLGNRADAMSYCQDVTERAPTWSDGWYLLGREYFLRGEFSLAQESFNHCSTLQVQQNTPISQRQFECWYLQGQAAELQGDCNGLLQIYNEFLAMNAIYPLAETWILPPDGPAICTTTP